MSENDIVYLETRMQRIRGRWHAMSRIARMGIVSSIFGAIGLLTSFLQDWIPFLSMPFSMVGLLIGCVAFLAGFYQNLRRDGFWFPLFGCVLSMLGLSIAAGGWNRVVETRMREREQQREEALAEVRSRLAGRWLKGSGDQQQSLEMTEGGSLLWRGPDAASEAEVTVARFEAGDSSLVIFFGDSGAVRTRSLVRYRIDASISDRLLVSDRRVISGNARMDMSGVWNRVGPPRKLTDAEQQIAEYRSQLQQFQEQEQRLSRLLADFESDRQELLDRLRPYEEGQPRDDRWTVWARELSTLVDQIRLLKDRQPTLQQAIVRLEAAIGHLTRQAELDQTGLDRTQLESLLLATDRLDEELRSIKTRESAEEFILQQTVQDELDRQTESATDRRP
jgi:hypothetical protein